MKYFDHPVRIRYGETDQMGVSYYANYLVWFEASRSDYFRQINLPYTEFEKQNIYLPVAEAYCKYLQPSCYDQLIYVRVSVSELKFSRMIFNYHVLTEDKKNILAKGYTVHFFIGSDRKVMRIPSEIKHAVELYKLEDILCP